MSRRLLYVIWGTGAVSISIYYMVVMGLSGRYKITRSAFWETIVKGEGFLSVYLEEHLEKRTYETLTKTMNVFSIVIYVFMIVLGVNAILKGVLDPYGPGFWILFRILFKW